MDEQVAMWNNEPKWTKVPNNQFLLKTKATHHVLSFIPPPKKIDTYIHSDFKFGTLHAWNPMKNCNYSVSLPHLQCFFLENIENIPHSPWCSACQIQCPSLDTPAASEKGSVSTTRRWQVKKCLQNSRGWPLKNISLLFGQVRKHLWDPNLSRQCRESFWSLWHPHESTDTLDHYNCLQIYIVVHRDCENHNSPNSDIPPILKGTWPPCNFLEVHFFASHPSDVDTTPSHPSPNRHIQWPCMMTSVATDAPTMHVAPCWSLQTSSP